MDKKLLENEIFNENRHQFIYGKNSEEQTNFFKGVSLKHGIAINESKPMAIYLDSIGLPNIKNENNNLDYVTLAAFASEYLIFSIVINLVDTLIKSVDMKTISDRILPFLDGINEFGNSFKISSLEELNNVLKNVRASYHNEYINYVKTGISSNKFLDSLPICFIELDIFVDYLKKLLNNDSYFAIIIDNKEEISQISMQAINGLVCSRINGDISMKVVTDPKKWTTYYDLNGNCAENIHDYGTINFDEKSKVKIINKN